MTVVIILVVYLLGLVLWYRNRFRCYLNYQDANYNYNQTLSHFAPYARVQSRMKCQNFALIMAVFWPITVIPAALSYGIKSNLELAQEKAKIAKEGAELRETARKYGLEGWEHL